MAQPGLVRVRSSTVLVTAVPLPARAPARFAPVFLLTPARSFSSVIAAMLGQHPQLYGFPELRLFRAARVAGLLSEPPPGTGMPARERAAGLVRALAQVHEGEQSAAAAERAWRWLVQRSDWRVALLFDHLLARVEPLVGVEKSPETSLTDEALADADQAYPAARYVHLVRHPWATVASMMVAWKPVSYWPVPREQAAQFCTELWLAQHGRIAEFGARIGSARYLRLRAEDMLNRTDEVLPRLCRWLAVDADERCIADMLRPERSLYAGPGPACASGGFDPSFLARPQRRDVVLPALTPAPASWRLAGHTQSAAIRMGHRFGYLGPGQHEPIHPAGYPVWGGRRWAAG
jgi:Sulfotransferase family